VAAPFAHDEQGTTNHLCLVYDDEKKPGAMSRSESDAFMDERGAVNEGVRKSRHVLSSEALHLVPTATTVRVRNRKVSITDGPCAETKEQLGGLVLIEARDVNGAVGVAPNRPAARMGEPLGWSVEVWSFEFFEQPWPRARR
jgi:hypothetical protein